MPIHDKNILIKIFESKLFLIQEELLFCQSCQENFNSTINALIHIFLNHSESFNDNGSLKGEKGFFNMYSQENYFGKGDFEISSTKEFQHNKYTQRKYKRLDEIRNKYKMKRPFNRDFNRHYQRNYHYKNGTFYLDNNWRKNSPRKVNYNRRPLYNRYQ